MRLQIARLDCIPDSYRQGHRHTAKSQHAGAGNCPGHTVTAPGRATGGDDKRPLQTPYPQKKGFVLKCRIHHRAIPWLKRQKSSEPAERNRQQNDSGESQPENSFRQ